MILSGAIVCFDFHHRKGIDIKGCEKDLRNPRVAWVQVRNAGALRLLALQMTLFGASLPVETAFNFKCWIVLACEAVTPTSLCWLPSCLGKNHVSSSKLSVLLPCWCTLPQGSIPRTYIYESLNASYVGKHDDNQDGCHSASSFRQNVMSWMLSIGTFGGGRGKGFGLITDTPTFGRQGSAGTSYLRWAN